MNAKQKIKLDKVIRFSRMASQGLDDLIYNDTLTDAEKKVLEEVEQVYTDAVAQMARLK